MKPKLKEKINEAVAAVVPITVIVLLLGTFAVPMDVGTIVLFLVGAVMLIVGMGLFQLGAEMAMTPLGEGVGTQLSKSRKLMAVLLAGLVLGIVITIAEPDLQVLAGQVPSIPANVLVVTVAVGVGVMLAVAILRVLLRWSLSTVLWVLYGAMLVVSLFAPGDFLAVAFDAGGVTTGPITVPFIMAMGVGLAAVRSDRDASGDSFGFVAICSAGPILAVLLLGIFYNPQEAAYTAAGVPTVATMRDVTHAFAVELPRYAKEVLSSLLPVVLVFLAFQLFSRRFRKRELMRMSVGFLYTYLGLVLFLCGVSVGFAPVGSLLGSQLAASPFRWLLIPIGMLIGFFIVKAEPAVHVLNKQVEDVTEGAIPASAMNRCLSIGVAASVGLSMLRVLTGLPIYWILIPGYALALVLSRLVPKIFVGIAFDAGGVASGPMTTTFLLPLAIGASAAVGGNLMTDAFGVIALVAMTPLIAVQLMGLVYAHRQKQAQRQAEEEDSDDILELEESYDEG